MQDRTPDFPRFCLGVRGRKTNFYSDGFVGEIVWRTSKNVNIIGFFEILWILGKRSGATHPPWKIDLLIVDPPKDFLFFRIRPGDGKSAKRAAILYGFVWGSQARHLNCDDLARQGRIFFRSTLWWGEVVVSMSPQRGMPKQREPSACAYYVLSLSYTPPVAPTGWMIQWKCSSVRFLNVAVKRVPKHMAVSLFLLF